MKGKNSSGRGLGLAFIQAVVRAHGGRIVASNRPEGGARLQIALPLAEMQSAQPVQVLATAAR